ncbi:hypothetical protein VV869_11890 [Photobacterium sp. MCCC 1A19761]|uniref:hypothetical protein n=1 Tax=Photobacterium sp. MCCC 1A19761 TaxID=3115000 RepID=UPI00307DB692
MKNKALRGRPRKGSNDVQDVKDEKPNNIHQIRRKIEDILLEREQKKLLDL